MRLPLAAVLTATLLLPLPALADPPPPAPAAEAPQVHSITVGTGAVDDLYYPVAGALQRAVNRSRREHNIRLSVETTEGSVQNLQLLAGGRIDMALVQGDVQRLAVAGEGDAFPQPASGLRALFSLYEEPFTIVARSDAGIQTVADLAGKAVGTGGPGSGVRLTMRAAMNELGWKPDSFARLEPLAGSAAATALCSRQLDAFVIVSGAPAPAAMQAAGSCGAVLVPARDGKIDLLLQHRADYGQLTIPAGTYPGQSADISTFGARATVVATTAMSDDDAYEIVRAVFENLATVKAALPALGDLDPKLMAGEGLAAPLHDGALRYFQEKNLIAKPAPAAAPAPAANP